MSKETIEGCDTISVLTRNAIKCLQCCTVLESKYQHDYQSCKCSNQAFVDGGLSYQRLGAYNFDLIENLSEYTTYDKVEFETKLKERKLTQDIRDQELLIKLFEGYNVWFLLRDYSVNMIIRKNMRFTVIRLSTWDTSEVSGFVLNAVKSIGLVT